MNEEVKQPMQDLDKKHVISAILSLSFQNSISDSMYENDQIYTYPIFHFADSIAVFGVLVSLKSSSN